MAERGGLAVMRDAYDSATLPDLLHHYEDKVAGSEATERTQKDMLRHRHEIYDFFKGEHGLGQLGMDEHGRPVHTKYGDAIQDKGERIARAKHTLYKLALHGKAKETGRSLEEMATHWEDMYANVKDDLVKHRELRRYIESHAISDELKQKGIQTFGQLAEHLAETDVLAELEQGDSVLKSIAKTYARNLHPMDAHAEEITPRIIQRALESPSNYETFRGLVNSRLADYNLQLRHIPSAQAIEKALRITLPSLFSKNPQELLHRPEHLQQDHVEYITQPSEEANLRYFPKPAGEHMPEPEVIDRAA